MPEEQGEEQSFTDKMSEAIAEMEKHEDEYNSPEFEDSGEEDDAPAKEAPKEIPADEGDEADESDDDEQEGVSDSAPEIDADLLARAEAIGWSKEQAAGFGENLSTVLDAVDRQAMAMSGSQQESSTQPEPKQEEQAPKFDIDKMFPEGEFDEDLRKGIKEINEYHEGRYGELASKYEEMAQYIQGENQRAVINRFDEYVSSLGDDWKTVFGDGKSLSLDPKAEAYGNRDKLLLSAEKLAAVYPNASEHELFEKARRLEFGEHEKKINDAALAKKVQKRAKNFTPRAGNRGKAERTSPDARARAKVADMLQHMPDWDADDDIF